MNGYTNVGAMTIKGLHILTNLLVLYVALSCNREGDESCIPISFAVDDYHVEVRGGESNVPDFDAFGVFAFVNDEELLMDKVRVTDKGAYWSADTPYYWPQKDGSHVDFYAYSPFSDQPSDVGLEFSYDENTGKPKFTFTMSESADVDLMVAKSEGRTAAGGSVPMVFRHLLCKVQFSFSVSNEGGYSYLVNEIKVNGTPLVANYDWSADEFDVVQTGSISVHIGEDDGSDHLIDSTEPVLIEDFTMYLMPGNLGEVVVTINNDDPKTIDLSDVEISGEVQLNINFEVDLADMKFTTSVTKWVDGGTVSGNIS